MRIKKYRGLGAKCLSVYFFFEGEAHGQVEGGEGDVGSGVERAAGRSGGAGVVEVETAQHLHQQRLGEPLRQSAAKPPLSVVPDGSLLQPSPSLSPAVRGFFSAIVSSIPFVSEPGPAAYSGARGLCWIAKCTDLIWVQGGGTGARVT